MRSLSKLCVLLLAAGLLIAPASGAAASKSKKKKSKTEEVAKPKVDKYTKMFVNDKSCLTAKGPFLTLHKLKGKLYVEVPLKTIGREMLIASTISEASDTNLGTIGYKPTDPIHVKFTRIDTTIYLSQAVVPPVHDTNDPHMSKAIGRSTLPPIMHSYPLVCYNRDSSAMVIEMTKFFSGDNELLAPIKSTKGGVVNITGKFKSEGSVIDQIKSFEDNVTVKSYLSYSVTADLLGLMVIKKDEPMTVKVTRTILLLPEEAMRPRLADSRIGIFLTDMSRINGKKDKIEDFSVINRWNIQPKDLEAWKRGELVEPVKPIVFYLDDAFPALWREPIRRGVLRWNKAFEKIGFKNVMHIEDFPKDDPEFDPDNLKYSCIRHGTLVGRPPLGRDHQRLGADVQRRGEAGRQLAFRADRTGRRARARQGAARRRIPGVAGVHPRPRGGTLPRTDAQHGRIERLPRGFAPQRIVHAAARHDPLDHGLRAFQLRGPAGRQGRETHPAGPRTL